MQKYLKQLDTLLRALHLRERILVVLLAAAGLYFLVNILLLMPEQKKQQALQQQTSSLQKKLDAAEVALAHTSSQAEQGGLARQLAMRDSLSQTVAETDALLGLDNATSPQLSTLLKSILADNPGLTLVSLRTLPVTTISIATATPAAAAAPGAGAAQPPLSLYKYGVAVDIKGDYFPLMRYLEKLQRHPKRLIWYEVKLDVINYPTSALKMTIYTLSKQPNSPLG